MAVSHSGYQYIKLTNFRFSRFWYFRFSLVFNSFGFAWLCQSVVDCIITKLLVGSPNRSKWPSQVPRNIIIDPLRKICLAYFAFWFSWKFISKALIWSYTRIRFEITARFVHFILVLRKIGIIHNLSVNNLKGNNY